VSRSPARPVDTYRETLPSPRRVRVAGRDAVLLGWVTDQTGRRLYAEVITTTRFVPLSLITEALPDVS
jgi:hypothetical protein